MPRSRSRSPDPTRQEAGYKATLNNPRVSEGAKEHARQVLVNDYGDDIIDVGGAPSSQRRRDTNSEAGKYGSDPVESSRGEARSRTNVVRGLKAAMHNPLNTDMGREQARHKLEELGESPED